MEEWSKTLDEGGCSRARDVRAFPGNFDFLLSQPSPKDDFSKGKSSSRVVQR